jgi:hypothetical protein
MSTTNAMPTGEMQQLVDQRLDAIDRALLGLLPRQERLSIVGQVETRLRELAVAGPAVDADQQLPLERHVADAAHFGAPGESRSRRHQSRLALSSGVLGIVALALLFALPLTYLVLGSIGMFDEAAEILLGAHVVAVALGGTLAVALSIAGLVSLQRSRGRMAGHGWAITGLSTGPLPMFVGGLLVLVATLQIAAEPVSQVVTATAPVTVSGPSYSSGYPTSLPPEPVCYAPANASVPPMACPGPIYAAESTPVMVEPPLAPPGPVEPAVPPQPAGDAPHVAELPATR